MFYETPQFIREETKFFGLITFTQLGLLMFLFALVFLLIFSSWPRLLVILLLIAVVPLGFYIIFGELGGIKVYRLIPDIIRHLYLPKHYLWQKENTSSFYQSTKKQLTTSPTSKMVPRRKNIDPEMIKKLSQLLDQ